MADKILLVEDDPLVHDALQLHLTSLGYALVWAKDGKVGLEHGLSGEYALVVLDVELPLLHGLEVCRRLREHSRSLPILMLTSRSGEADKVLALETGADDYITKPFSALELTARVRALLRRAQVTPPTTEAMSLIFGDLRIEPIERRVILNGVEIEFTLLEFDLLYLLASNPGKPFTKDQLLRDVWSYESSGYQGTVTTHVNRIRNKIEADSRLPRFLKTVWGLGYRFTSLEEIERGE